MTLEEMKLAVCEKLPDLFFNYLDAECGNERVHTFRWTNTGELVHWSTEGLQVCHEAEKKLTAIEYMKWWPTLCRVIWGSPITMESSTRLVHEATYEQRLEALCRVWFPERFN